MTVRTDRRKGWMIDYVHMHADGRKERVRKRSPVQTRRGAESFERQVQEQTMMRARPDAEPRRREVPTFERFSSEFMRTYARINNKPSEVETKEAILRIHLTPELGKLRLDGIGVQRIESLKALLIDKGLSAKSVNNVLAVLSKILTYAVEIEVLSKKPRIRLLKVPPSKFDFLDFDEYDRLVAALAKEKYWGAAILTAGDAGLRVGEILGLYQEDIDHRAGVLTVRRSLWKGILGSPKSGKERKIPMTARLAMALKEQRHLKGDFLWSTPEGHDMTKKMAQRALERACKRAGLRMIGWHVLRHTFCSHLAMKGAAPKAIQDLAGHKSIQTTMRYMHLAPSALVEAIHLLEAPGNNPEDLQAHGTNVAPLGGQIRNVLES